MSDAPEKIRADIDQTRRELGLDVDALADKVTPSKIMDRQTDKLKGALGSVRERIMGVADDAGSTMAATGASVGEHLEDAKERVVAKAEGNPLAVGLIAFGAGLLLASLLPASAKEKQIAEAMKEQAQPLMDEASDVAKEIGEHLKEPAREAAAAVEASAQESAEVVREEVRSAAGEVRDQAQQARENVARD